MSARYEQSVRFQEKDNAVYCAGIAPFDGDRGQAVDTERSALADFRRMRSDHLHAVRFHADKECQDAQREGGFDRPNVLSKPRPASLGVSETLQILFPSQRQQNHN